MDKPADGEITDRGSPPAKLVERAPAAVQHPTERATERQAERAPGLVERRRPGRIEYTNPALIALLRRTTTIPAQDDAGHPDDVLAPARGVVFGVPIGAAIWCAIGLGVWLLFR